MNKIILLLLTLLLFPNCTESGNTNTNPIDRTNRFISQEIIGFPHYDPIKGNVKSISETDYDLVLEDGEYVKYTSSLRYFEYSEDGRLVTYKYENPYENFNMQFIYEGDRLTGIEGGDYRIDIDKDGNIEKLFPLYSSSPEIYYMYQYDSDRRIIRKSNNGADLGLAYITAFEYDEKGRMIKRTETCGDAPESYFKFEYNIEDLVWQTEVKEADDTEDVYEYIYEYDDFHNWVSRRKSFRSEGTKYYVLTERSIEY